MLSKNPTGGVSKMTDPAQALRLAIIAELDAINLYEQLAMGLEDEDLKRVFLDVAKEEKAHLGEFLALLKRIDREQVEELERGEREVEELLEGI